MTIPQKLFSGNSDHSSPAFVDPVMGLSNYSETAYRVSRVGSKTPTAPPYSPKPTQGRRYLSDSTLNTSSKAVTNFMHNHRQVEVTQNLWLRFEQGQHKTEMSISRAEKMCVGLLKLHTLGSTLIRSAI